MCVLFIVVVLVGTIVTDYLESTGDPRNTWNHVEMNMRANIVMIIWTTRPCNSIRRHNVQVPRLDRCGKRQTEPKNRETNDSGPVTNGYIGSPEDLLVDVGRQIGGRLGPDVLDAQLRLFFVCTWR